MTVLQWVGLTAALLAITGVLWLLIWVTFTREDRRQERRRAMDKHPSTRAQEEQRRMWDDGDNLS
jgi:hypothetical protein